MSSIVVNSNSIMYLLVKFRHGTYLSLWLLLPTTYGSKREGKVFTGICDSVQGKGGGGVGYVQFEQVRLGAVTWLGYPPLSHSPSPRPDLAGRGGLGSLA